MIKLYPKSNGEGFTADEIKRGIHWLYADVNCVNCGKVQPLAATHYIGGPCIKCGLSTTGKGSDEK